MGADGGVVHIRLKHPTPERYRRVVELLKPFWQFLSEGGRSDVAEEAQATWETDNLGIGVPAFLVGYYGTDRGDSQDLGDLRDICEFEQDVLYALTFADLDLDCRTVTPALTRDYFMHPLHRLWLEHFRFASREKVLAELGQLVDMVVSVWVAELRGDLDFSSLQHEETWT